jgi:Domain of Unknown Function (DUF1080)
MLMLRSAVFASLCVLGSVVSAQDGFKEIFNGKDLTGWKGNSELWSVEDGCITGKTSADKPLKFNTFLIWEGTVSDFELEFDYKIGAEGNSGVQYRSKVLNPTDFVVGGYQADIDATLKFAGINYEEKGRAILAQRGQRVTIDNSGVKNAKIESIGDADELGKAIKKEDWNHYRLVAKGNKLSHMINDKLMSEVIDSEEGKAAAEGVLAFQIHTGPVMKIQFKNVRLKSTKN